MDPQACGQQQWLQQDQESNWPTAMMLMTEKCSFNATQNSTGAMNILPTGSDFYTSTEWMLVSNLAQGFLQWLISIRMLFYLVWPSETMFPSLKFVPRYVTEMFPVFFLVAIFENAIRLLQGKSTVRTNETIGSLSQGIFQECLRIKVRSIEVLMYCLVWDHLRLATLPWNSLWTWWICYICVDMGFYWAHRLAHEVNFIWAIHQAHHSSEEFSVVAALRQAVLQPFTAWFTYMPLALFIPPQVFLAHLQLSELYMAWLHTEVISTIGPLEYILNTPSHHRVHHSRNPEYIDKNYGGMLIIWDRLFGTFKAEDQNNPPVYGLVHPVDRFEPFYVQFHTWPVIWSRVRQANGLANKLGVLFMGPGWRPGLARLGNPEELPPIVRPVNSYNPELNFLKNVYIVIHFGLVLVFYHELTLHQSGFSAIVLNVGVLSLIASITSLGLMLDNRWLYNGLFELTRCLLFFRFERQVGEIMLVGLEKAGFGEPQQAIMMSAIVVLFKISVLINIAHLAFKFSATKRTSSPINILAKLTSQTRSWSDKKTAKLL